MKTIRTVILLTGLLIGSILIIPPLSAQTQRIIHLKDGSILQGRVIELTEGVYKIDTENLGQIEIPEQNIINISSIESASQPRAAQQTDDYDAMIKNLRDQLGSNTNPGQYDIAPKGSGTIDLGGLMGNNPALKQQIQQMQGQVLADPNLMADIQQLVSDPQVQSMLMDPAFMQLMMNPDPQQLQNNPKFQALINNPQIREVLEKFMRKYSNKQ